MKKLYYGGDIVTLEGSAPEAVLTDGERITGAGPLKELKRAAGPDAVLRDLRGHALLPAFIDAHSHLSSYAMSLLQAKLDDARSFDDIIASLRDYAKDCAPGDWIIANGYDHNLLAEHAHPTAAVLDSAFPGTPVVLQHKSGHFGVMNTAALEALGLSRQYPDGYLEESAYVSAVKRTPMPSMERTLAAYKRAQLRYASYGITTVQEGMMVRQMLPIYGVLLSDGSLFLDTVGYPEISDADAIYDALPEYAGGYRNGFRLGGYKMILDGSPQGRTAWMLSPYAGGGDYRSSPAMEDEKVFAAFKKALDGGRQLLAHCNGDAAADQFIRAARAAGGDVASIRPVIIHAQLLRREQLPDVKALGLIPSFFVAHVYHWGDVHIENFGFERASAISPAASAEKLGIPFTFHQDSPVIEPDMLETVWCAVRRETKGGVILGEDERVSPETALRAVTISAAAQYGEEKEKGSILPGKLADLVILDKDPLAVPPEKLRGIRVLETIKRGATIFSAEN